ncbi:hypothetical protein C8F04DRAFT_1130982 [Mycena alexandri]|uniref:Uncharacterized protein n=1 Tax=Mycena alexandri TaxID=1745969 RepID=A0AAD6WV61_9AGAR|nr:hypothetical protein C8F04DRAFT_1130982 [Mycena alexandri]
MSSQSSVATNALASDPGVEQPPVEAKVEHTADVAKSLASSVPTDALASGPGVEQPPLQAKAEHTADVARYLGTPRDLYEFRVYNVPRPGGPGSRATFSSRETIYNRPGDEAMHAVIRRYLNKIQWIQRMSWNNDTDAPQYKEYEQFTGLTITQGSDVTNGFNLGASYEGMSIGIDHSTRTFKSTETTETWKETIKITVPPRSELIFYQKRFDFTDEIYFILDAWGHEHTIASWGEYYPLTTKVTSVYIMAEEYYTRSGNLPEGPGAATADSVLWVQLPLPTLKRESATQRARNVLADMGL